MGEKNYTSNIDIYCVMLLGSKVHCTPGDRWMIHGPTDYIPRTEIGNIQRRLVFMYNVTMCINLMSN